MENAIAYIPLDRCRALAAGETLPDRATGSVLFADISGFTPLSETLAQTLGDRRGADELTRQLNLVYGALIAEVHRFAGSVVGFSGDAITCWFDAASPPLSSPARPSVVQAALRATACALAMQQVMDRFSALQIAPNVTASLAIKVAVATGAVRRFLVGNPRIQLLDVLAGSTLDHVAEAEQLAHKGEILLDAATVAQLQDRVEIGEWRNDPETGHACGVVTGLVQTVSPQEGGLAGLSLEDEHVRPWLLPAIYERLRDQQDRFLAELRPAVALFVKFGGLDYDNDEEAGRKLDAFVRWVQEVLARYEGSLIQLTTGDKGSYLYAVFGAPVTHDDDAGRAAAAALALRVLPPQLRFISDMRMGISQGRMRVGPYGSDSRRTYGVLGDAANLAARLMSRAEPGQILVSPRIADAVGDSYRLEPLGMAVLKGRQEPLPVQALLGRRYRQRAQLASLFANPLVGREAEAARIARILETALSGSGQILRIEGGAGVGKSHLAAHLVQQAMAREVQIAVGICQSTSRDIAYYPCRQVVSTLLGLPDMEPGEPESAQIAQVESALVAMNRDWLLRLPLLGDLLGLAIPDNATTAAFDPRLRQEALIALTVEIVQARARNRPLLLLFEDVHWIDEASQGLVLALGRVIADAPVLLALVQRPPGREETPPLAELAELPYHTHLVLDELPYPAISTLVSQRLHGDVSPLALSLIHAQAQGNPFFSEELVHALVESGHLVRQGSRWDLSASTTETLINAGCLTRKDGRWALVTDAPLSSVSLGLPDSIHGIVLSRLDRLPEPPKLTLKAASVIGRIFEFDLLVRFHPARPSHALLQGQLDMLETRNFARLEAAQSLTYIFKHNITQEVVYRTLLEDQQKELHGAVAEVLEQWWPDAVERLAFHFRHGDLSQPWLRTKALYYLGAAGRRAQREYANETALAHYNRALALEPRWEWLAAKVEILHILGRRQEEEAALEALTAMPDVPVVDVAYLWGEYYEAISDYARAKAAVERALVAYRGAGNLQGEMSALTRLGMIAWRQGNYDEAEAIYSQALNLPVNRTDYPNEEAEILYGLGILYRQQGQYEKASVQLEQALALNRMLGSRQEEARTLTALGTVANLQRDYNRALNYYQEALDIRRAIGDRAGEGESYLSLAQALRGAGDYSQAEQLLRSALAIQQAINNRWWETIVWNELGILYLLVGNLEAAEESLQEGLKLSQEIGDAAGEAYVLCNLGQVVRDRGDLETAEELLTHGLTIARSQGDRYLEAPQLSDLAIVSLHAGRLEQAVERASTALALFQEMNLPLSTTTDLTTLATAHLAAGDRAQALNYAHQALRILDGCGGVGPDFPHRDYFICYRVLSAVGQTHTAGRCLQSAYSLLMSQADKITDPTTRRSYLERVTFNREIVQEARRAGPAAGPGVDVPGTGENQ